MNHSTRFETFPKVYSEEYWSAATDSSCYYHASILITDISD